MFILVNCAVNSFNHAGTAAWRSGRMNTLTRRTPLADASARRHLEPCRVKLLREPVLVVRRLGPLKLGHRLYPRVLGTLVRHAPVARVRL